MKSISCLMLDMGGVITQKHRLDKVDELMSILGLECSRETFLDAYFRLRFDYDRGTADGSQYWGAITKEFRVPLDAASVPDLVQADLESWFNMRKPMVDYLGGVKGRVRRLVLLSNIHADGARFIRSDEGRAWASHFDELVLSCEHKLLKPEPEIYDLALSAARAQPSDTLFVDDNIENVEGARRAGMSSFRFIDEDDFVATIARDYELIG